MARTIPADRLPLSVVASRQYAAMYRLSSSVELDPRLRVLIELRASQLNGCAFCVDMHWKDARAGGESEERLYMLSAWRESPVYSTRERVAHGDREYELRLVGGVERRTRPRWCRPLSAGCDHVRRQAR